MWSISDRFYKSAGLNLVSWALFQLMWPGVILFDISRVSCQKGPTRHAYAWQIGPFWQDTLDMCASCQPSQHTLGVLWIMDHRHLGTDVDKHRDTDEAGTTKDSDHTTSCRHKSICVGRFLVPCVGSFYLCCNTMFSSTKRKWYEFYNTSTKCKF